MTTEKKISTLYGEDEEIQYTVDGDTSKQSTLLMCSPPAGQAIKARDKYFNAMSSIPSDIKDISEDKPLPPSVAAKVGPLLDNAIAAMVGACISKNSVNTGMSGDEVRVFLSRIGGQSSEVANFAMKKHGVSSNSLGGGDEDPKPSKESNATF